MAVTQARRLALFAAARRTLGRDEAETLMEVVVPDGAELVTKADLRSDLAELRSWFSTLLLTVSLAQTAVTVTLVVALRG